MRLIVATGATFLGAALVLAAAPANDAFADRAQLIGTNLVVAASNVEATKEPGEPDHAGNPGGKSLWWAWTAPTNGDLTIHTDDSDFNTLLAIYSGTSVATLSLVASNDDHGVGFTSRVRFQATAGNQYQIVVDGYSDGTDIWSGNVVLSLSFVPEPITRPPNDNFRDRTPVNEIAPTVAGSNNNATRQPGEPIHAGRLGDASVWWSWTAPANEQVRITTEGSSFDTILAVYTGSSVSNLTMVAANDDEDGEHGVLTSAVTFDAATGQSYAIAVDGFDGAMGNVVLSLAPEAPWLQNLVLENNTFRVSLQTLTGRTYYLEYKNSISDASWTRLPGVAGNGAVTSLTNRTVGVPSRFYRVAVE